MHHAAEGELHPVGGKEALVMFAHLLVDALRRGLRFLNGRRRGGGG
jgi:hypothetical protein